MDKIKKTDFIDPVKIARLDEMPEKEPVHAQIERTDLVLIKDGQNVSVLYGRCLHRGALLADGFIDGQGRSSAAANQRTANLEAQLVRTDARAGPGLKLSPVAR